VYEVFCEDVDGWTYGLLLIMNFFVFLELAIQIRLCKSWFNAVAASMIHT